MDGSWVPLKAVSGCRSDLPIPSPIAPLTGSLGIWSLGKGRVSVLGRTLGFSGPGVHDPGSPWALESLQTSEQVDIILYLFQRENVQSSSQLV